MTALGSWLRKLVGTAIILGFMELILPEGDLRRFARVVMGLLVVFTLLQPLAGFLRQDPNLDRLFTTDARPNSSPEIMPQAAATRISAAGLDALERARQTEMEQSIKTLCAEEAGATVARVVVTNAGGQPRVSVWLRQANDLARVKSLIISHYLLPETAVEVIYGE